MFGFFQSGNRIYLGPPTHDMCSNSNQLNGWQSMSQIRESSCQVFIGIVPQRERKFKKVQAKKLVKSNKSINFFREIAFLAV